MMLPDWDDRAGLRSLVTFRFGNDDADLAAHRKVVETADNAVAMEIDLFAPGCLDETVVLGQADHLAMVRHGMCFDLSAHYPDMVLEQPVCRVESVADRNINILVGMVLRAGMTDEDVLPGTLMSMRTL